MFSPSTQNQRRPTARLYRLRDATPGAPQPVGLDALPRQLCAAFDQSRIDPGAHTTLESVRVALFAHTAAPSIWRESLCTALLAVPAARLLDCSAGPAALAGLLHRGGEVGGDNPWQERWLKSWRLPPATLAAIRSGRRFSEHRRMSREAIAVYVAQLLALEVLHPEFSAPGMAASLAAEFGISRESLDSIRQQFLSGRLHDIVIGR